MSVEDEKKPRKAPAKKKTSAAPPADAAATAKVEAAAPKSAAPRKKASAKTASEVSAAVPDRVEAVSKPRPTYAEIAERAHSYFVARGRSHGHHEEDWLRAERELLSGS